MATIAELSDQAKDLLGRLRLCAIDNDGFGRDGLKRHYGLSWWTMSVYLAENIASNSPTDQIALDELLEEDLVEIIRGEGERRLVELTPTGLGAVRSAGDLLPHYMWFTNRDALASPTSGIPACLPEFDRHGGLMVIRSLPQSSWPTPA